MNIRLKVAVLSLILAIGGLSSVAAAADEDYAARLEKLLPGMSAAEIPARKDAQMDLERLCHEAAAPGREADRAKLAEAMIARLDARTAKPARVWMLRRIDTVGRDEVVPGLRALLKESDREIRDLARRALMNNPSGQAVAALRDALAAADEPEWQVALIDALSWRRDAQSVAAIARLAAAPELAVAQAAISALGSIADDASVSALANLHKTVKPQLRSSVSDARLRAAERLGIVDKADAAAVIYEELLADSEPERVRISALTGLAQVGGADAAPVLIRHLNGNDARLQLIAARCLQRLDREATPAIVRAVQQASPAAKALLLETLGEHGNVDALKAVAGEVTAEDAQVRLAALGAIAKLGNSSVLALLIERGIRSEGPEREMARTAVSSLHGADVDGLILERLGKASGGERVELLYAVWGRRIAAAKPIVLKAAGSGDEPARIAALTALERIARPEDLAALASVLVSAPGEAIQKITEEAIASACRRSGDVNQGSQAVAEAMADASTNGRVAAIRMLALLQSDEALPVVRAAAKSGDTRVMEAAVAALKDWKPAWVTTWMFSGPYRKEGAGASDLLTTPFAPESSPGSAEWKPLRQNRRDAQEGIDLQRIARGQDCCGYARTIVHSDREQDVIFTFGSDDGIKVWLDDQVIHTNNVTRGLNCGADQAKATLKAGDNVLLVKVSQGGGDWSFCCRIGSVEGGPPDNVRFEAK